MERARGARARGARRRGCARATLQHANDQDVVPDAAIADLALGEAKLALHAPGEAIAPLEHALAIAEKGFDLMPSATCAPRSRAR